MTLMSHAGFSSSCEGGSHFTFEHSTSFRLSVSKTHPSGILKSYQVKAVKEALEFIGKQQEKSNGNR